MKDTIYLFENDLTPIPTAYGSEKIAHLFAYIDKHLGNITSLHLNSYRRHDGCFFTIDIKDEVERSLSLTLIPDVQHEWADYLHRDTPIFIAEADIYLADSADAFKLMQIVSKKVRLATEKSECVELP